MEAKFKKGDKVKYIIGVKPLIKEIPGIVEDVRIAPSGVLHYGIKCDDGRVHVVPFYDVYDINEKIDRTPSEDFFYGYYNNWY